jgi:hypothetical protein
MKAILVQTNPWIWKGPGFIVRTGAWGSAPVGAVEINQGLFLLNIHNGKITLNK